MTRTLDELVDDVLVEVARYDERGYAVVTSADLAPSDVQVTLVDGDRVMVTDVIEIGNELILVTAKTDTATPTFTLSRGFDGTTAVPHASGSTGTVNPTFPRKRVAKVVQRAFSRLEGQGIFNVSSETVTRAPGFDYVELDSGIRDVLRVGYFSPSTMRFEPNVDGWQFFDDIPTSVITSGKIVRVPRYVMDADEMQVTVRLPFRWDSYPAAPSGSSTITLPEGTEDLPAQYAVASLCSRREISRMDLDRSEEWNRSQGYTSGIPTGLVKQLWAEFYRACDEAKRLPPLQDIPRPYIRKRRFL